MITPSIGRRVWFWPNKRSSTFATIDPLQPMDAGVVFVHSDREVNLFVTDHHGGTHFVPNCQLLQDSDRPADGASYAEWMPYQKGQAATIPPGTVRESIHPPVTSDATTSQDLKKDSDAGKASPPSVPLNKAPSK